MDRATVEIYERRAEEWRAERSAGRTDAARRLGASVRPGRWRADLGCGPGWHVAHLGMPVVAMDAAFSFCTMARAHTPHVVQGDLERLPFAPRSLGGALASKSYQHVPADRVPLALADLHRCLAVGAPVHLKVTNEQVGARADDPFAGRHFTNWRAEHFLDVVRGAGFTVEEWADDGEEWLDVLARRAETLADTVATAMRVLVVGLNPSEVSARAGHGFAGATNRFWRAATESGLVRTPRDPLSAIRDDGVGMTDLVKRATPRADAISRGEYTEGAARVERLTQWLQPGSVCFVGLAGYRAAIDRRARPGWQPTPFGGRPAYVMPSTSGANASSSLPALVAHLRACQETPPAT